MSLELCVALALSFAGFSSLALAMERHADEILPKPLRAPWPRLAQAGGSLLLLAALAVCIAAAGASVGVALWTGAMGFAAIALGLLLTYAPRRVAPLAAGLLALMLPVALWQAI